MTGATAATGGPGPDGGGPGPVLALHGGTPMRPHPIRTTVHLDDSARQEVGRLLDDGLLSDYYGGPLARRFEDAFARYHAPDCHAIAVNSGTSALHLSLAAAGVGPGDEVVLPAACYVSAATAIVQLGALPIVCDIEEQSLTLDVVAAERLVGPRTKAILPVHFWGYPADLDALRQLCDTRGLVLIEDSCQAPGARASGRPTGTYGDFAAYSFGNRKHIATGEGGMVLTRDAAAARRVRALSNVGKGPGWDDYESLGFSYRMVEFSALVGLHGLARLDEEIAARRYAADHYRDVLAGSGLTAVAAPEWGEAVYFKLPVLLPEEYAAERPFVVDAVNAENVSCRVPHRPLFRIEWLAELTAKHGVYRGPDECPVAARLLPRVIEVETGPNLPPDEADISARAVARVWRHVRGRS